MKIEVVGTGCATCNVLYELTCQAARELGIDDSEVLYTKGDAGTTRLIGLGLMTSPALVLDDQVVLSGPAKTVAQLKTLLSERQG